MNQKTLSFALQTMILAAATLCAAPPAAADPALQPGVSLTIPFGGPTPAPVRFSVRLDHAQPVGLGAAELRLPVPLEWRLDSSGRQALYGNGLMLGSGRIWRSDAAEGEQDTEQGWGWNVGTVLLAAGAALALVVAVAGETAEDLQEENHQSFGSGHVDDDNHTNCDVPVPDNPSVNGCGVGI